MSSCLFSVNFQEVDIAHINGLRTFLAHEIFQAKVSHRLCMFLFSFDGALLGANRKQTVVETCFK